MSTRVASPPEPNAMFPVVRRMSAAVSARTAKPAWRIPLNTACVNDALSARSSPARVSRRELRSADHWACASSFSSQIRPYDSSR